MDNKNHYQILQVDSEASFEVIEAAYRKLARLYHPDLNSSPDAVGVMQRINEAYSVLNNQNKRAAYDLTLQRSRPPQASHSVNTTASTVSRNSGRSTKSTRSRIPSNFPTKCQACGKSDATLRFAAFPYVISIIIMTFRRGWVVLC